MAEAASLHRRDSAEDTFQERMLQGVSRTFALTIPELPGPLRETVGNAYLLCRLADTIEDEPGLSLDRKRSLYTRFLEALSGSGSARAFADELHPLLTERTAPAERELARSAHRVIRAARGFDPPSRAAVERCLHTMCGGMLEFEGRRSLDGLRDLAELDRYCYFVAGVVGELLTELFCVHAEAIARREPALRARAAPFGQGLQLTNILKDLWEDRERGACWLPRAVFESHGCELGRLPEQWGSPGCGAALASLIGVARARLAEGLAYTLLIPREHAGIRRFCLWALGMAVLTLRRIDRRRDFRAAAEVKISRRSVRATLAVTRLCGGRDRLLEAGFHALTRALPAGSARGPGGSVAEVRTR